MNHILALLQKEGTPRKLGMLQEELGIGGELRPAFDEAVERLCEQGQVIVGAGGTVRLPSLSGEITGVFKAHARGYGFVSPELLAEHGDVFISGRDAGTAMTGDRVVAQIKQRGAAKGDYRLTGKVVRVLDRAHRRVVGVLRRRQDRWVVKADGSEFLEPIELDRVDAREVRDGDKVTVEIRKYPTMRQAARGVIEEVLGSPGRHDAEVSAIIRRYRLSEQFEESALVEAWNAKASFDPHDVHGREDLTQAEVLTIDPPDAQDFDDAVSLAKNSDGSCVLGVHIADVSRFVPANSALDRAALRRGNSVYLPGRTLPMLPEMLSNEICSLQPGQVRYTKSVFLTYNKDGAVRSNRFANTMIRSKARLSYEQAQAALDGRPGDLSERTVELLRGMESLARRIERRRRRAGMLQLPMPETKVLLDARGRVAGVQPEDQNYTHTIIEMFMLEANVAVARLLDRYCIPFMRRVHPSPNASAFRGLSQTLRALGVTLSRQPSRSDLQALLGRVRDRHLALPVNMLVLRSLQRAAYSPMNVGHYALASSKYCHFTSPIRRYADLLVHRALDAYLAGRADRARRAYSLPELVEIGEHLTETEQLAEDAENEVKTILALHLLAGRVGARVEGVVVNVTAYGAFVLLPEYGVEGMIQPETLGPDQWQFDDRHQCLVGRHTGRVLHLGRNLRVRIIAVHPAARRLDLAPLGMLPLRTSRRSGRRRGRRSRRRRSGRSQRR